MRQWRRLDGDVLIARSRRDYREKVLDKSSYFAFNSVRKKKETNEWLPVASLT
jgi:hypothetical protein